MTDFWPGQDPWNAFEHKPAWDDVGEPARDHHAEPGSAETSSASDNPPHAVAFVQQAIQRVYHP